ncbi:sensor histidine kinase [Pseudobacteriovorax antillogorgiicola]|uniref:histidine kinase n=1 Tax=Pseudobacteriovorax antillogorgiicola TaxID=1513793 RepID=A0A1Y6C5C9_9BACT|nr:HAMP domain-containing sensor histidine kinase [Pseudobacteriovorax antillogorgiicola]TCS49870.1 signal transduction histidine kinase [Pseudobacteriovorax antillogorgiicola]SMF43948.1 Signal transduction histidine kinase [Pseudobacteriovorax antillogorgiicola]
MKTKTNLKAITGLVFVSFLSLFITIAINIATKGRADFALLAVVADTARFSLNCTKPEESPLFLQPLHLPHSETQIDAWLFDRNGMLLAENRASSSSESIITNKRQAESYYQSAMLKPLIWNGGAWAKIDSLCNLNWTLFIHDPQNRIFKSTFYGRQRNLFVLVASSYAALIFLAWYYLRIKGNEAMLVLRKFSEGKLDVRLQIRSWEKSIELYHEFNKMASEVARLFDQVKSLEDQRSQSLRELAHDTRTPIASLISGLDTLREFSDSMEDQQKQKIYCNMQADLEYFSRLIEDLFLLSEIDSFSSDKNATQIDLWRLLEEAWNQIFRHEDHDSNLEVKLVMEKQPCKFVGSRILIQRMVINLLENAKRYGVSWVTCSARIKDRLWILEITNDSYPLALNLLESWGHKRQQRLITESGSRPHTSLGLGSAIAKRIAESHRGGATIDQIINEDTALLAKVRITVVLPLL